MNVEERRRKFRAGIQQGNQQGSSGGDGFTQSMKELGDNFNKSFQNSWENLATFGESFNEFGSKIIDVASAVAPRVVSSSEEDCSKTSSSSASESEPAKPSSLKWLHDDHAKSETKSVKFQEQSLWSGRIARFSASPNRMSPEPAVEDESAPSTGSFSRGRTRSSVSSKTRSAESSPDSIIKKSSNRNATISSEFDEFLPTSFVANIEPRERGSSSPTQRGSSPNQRGSSPNQRGSSPNVRRFQRPQSAVSASEASRQKSHASQSPPRRNTRSPEARPVRAKDAFEQLIKQSQDSEADRALVQRLSSLSTSSKYDLQNNKEFAQKARKNCQITVVKSKTANSSWSGTKKVIAGIDDREATSSHRPGCTCSGCREHLDRQVEHFRLISQLKSDQAAVY